MNAADPQAIERILQTLIPDSDDGSIPGAARVIEAESLLLIFGAPETQTLFEQLNDAARRTNGKNFGDLDVTEVTRCITENRITWSQLARRIGPAVLRAYFGCPQVLAAMGLVTRAPFPEGFVINEIDYDLLEPVFNRGKKYRDIESA